MEYKSRKLNRLYGREYLDGCYFVTVCTKDRKKYFCEEKDGQLFLNEFGKIVEQQWLWLKENYNYIRLYRYVVMPNHFHGLIVIDRMNSGDVVRTGRDLSLQNKIKSLSELIGAFKTTSSKLIHRAGLSEFGWQRSFYDRIIRNEKEFDNASDYILNNPLNWHRDRNNLEDLFM